MGSHKRREAVVLAMFTGGCEHQQCVYRALDPPEQ
jgi:hypothetical protein